MKNYDCIVIGTGAGNIVLEAALDKGLKCAQVEMGKFGGTCLTRGCIPTKVMITAADLVNDIKDSERIGINSKYLGVDWDKLSKRVWSKIDESKDLYEYYLEKENLDVYRAKAEFIDNNTIRLIPVDGGEEVEISGDKIFINVGGRTNIPDIEGLEEAGYITSETLFGEKYPKNPYDSLIVIGGGPIGTEFAHVFSSFGSKVKIIQRNVRMLPKEDKEMSEQIKNDLICQGIEIHLNKTTTKVEVKDGLKHVTIVDKSTGKEEVISAEEILVSPGIKSNADLLKLENTDIILDEKGWIKTNELLETSAKNVWAFGDINGRQQFRHKANYEAYILEHNLFLNDDNLENWRWADYSMVPSVTYTHPQVAHVGLNEESARKAGYDFEVVKKLYSSVTMGYAMGYEPGDADDGFVKIIADKKTQSFLGVHIIGPKASMLIQPYINLMNCGRKTIKPINEEIASETAKKLREMPLIRHLKPNKINTVKETMVPHPALTELVIWAAEEFKKI